MKLNWYYIFIGVFFVTMIFVSLKFFRGSAHTSVGIAYSREYSINAEKSAMILAVNVVPGQEVKAGDKLVELTSQQLEIDIEKLNNRIQILHQEQGEKSKLAASEIAFMKAEQGVAIEEINAAIDEAESEYELNIKLTKEFAASSDTSRSKNNPLDVKINSLRKQKQKLGEAVAIKEKDIIQESETEKQLIQNQIVLLEQDLALLKQERKKLTKYAEADGVVGNVYVKAGQQVNAFTNVLSVNPKYPSMVIGYLVGKKDEIAVGSAVTVRSYEDKRVEISGKVIGYGSVVELPLILQKSTAVKAFGREVFIEVAPGNGLASGEKVLIR